MLVVVALLVWKGGPRERPPERATWSAALSMSAPAPPVLPSAVMLPSALPPAPLPPAFSARPLPPGAPKSVRCGVVLFQYRGAQFASDGSREKAEALDAAKAAVDVAKKSFKAAVKLGDPGSTEDAGRITRGILEPSVELEVFSLSPGAVSEPIDTPRGYWVAKRLE